LVWQPWVEWFTSEVMQTPIVRVPDHKRSFLPSRIEARKVAKMVHAIKMGWMKPREQKKQSQEPKFYMLWQTDEGVEHMRRIQNHIPAPKRHLPGHAESYNPPPEYLFDKREVIMLRCGVCFLCVMLVRAIADNTEKLILCNGSDCKTPLFQKDVAPVTSPVSYNVTIETDFPTPPPMLAIKHQKQKGVI